VEEMRRGEGRREGMRGRSTKEWMAHENGLLHHRFGRDRHRRYKTRPLRLVCRSLHCRDRIRSSGVSEMAALAGRIRV